MKRNVDIAVLSDLHLGTYGSHTKELLNYLREINPKKLILNGDIFDIWDFNKKYFTNTEIKIIKRILKISRKSEVIYVIGNHDEFIRKFQPLLFGNIKIVNEYNLCIDDKKYLVVHGDIFDVSIQQTKWLAKIGSVGYDILIRLNRFVDKCMKLAGKEKVSISKKVKLYVKEAVKFISDFETIAIDYAKNKKYDGIILGHIHQECIREDNNFTYLNSGDYVESLTSLEYNNKKWTIHYYEDTLRNTSNQ